MWFGKGKKNWIEYAEVYSETNKDIYFGKNTKIGIIRAWGTGFRRIKESLTRGLTISVLGTILAMIVSFFLTAGYNLFTKAVLIAPEIAVLLIAVRIICNIESGINDLNLRRYGETWVRHSFTAGIYWGEIYLYVYDLTPYGNVMRQDDKKALFREPLPLCLNSWMWLFAVKSESDAAVWTYSTLAVKQEAVPLIYISQASAFRTGLIYLKYCSGL